MSTKKAIGGSLTVTGGEFGIESSVLSLTGYIMVTCIAFVMLKAGGKRQG